MVWAVLFQRQAMATFLWQHGEEALAKVYSMCRTVLCHTNSNICHMSRTTTSCNVICKYYSNVILKTLNSIC